MKGDIKMERQFLKDLGISDENIEKIMSQNGVDVNKVREGMTALGNQLNEANQKLSQYAGVNIKGLQDELQTQKNLVDSLQKQKDSEISALRRESKIDLAMAGLKFTSEFARQGIRQLLVGDERIANDDKFDDNYKTVIEELKKNDSYKDAFVIEQDDKNKQKAGNGKPYFATTQQGSGNNQLSREEYLRKKYGKDCI